MVHVYHGLGMCSPWTNMDKKQNKKKKKEKEKKLNVSAHYDYNMNMVDSLVLFQSCGLYKINIFQEEFKSSLVVGGGGFTIE